MRVSVKERDKRDRREQESVSELAEGDNKAILSLSLPYLLSSLSPPWFLVLNTTSHSSKNSTALFIWASRNNPFRSWEREGR